MFALFLPLIPINSFWNTFYSHLCVSLELFFITQLYSLAWIWIYTFQLQWLDAYTWFFNCFLIVFKEDHKDRAYLYIPI